MSSAAAIEGSGEAGATPPKKRKLPVLMIGAVLLVIALVAGLWFSGILPGLLGMNKAAAEKSTEQAAKQAAHAAPVFADLPEMVANLNAPGRRPSYVKLKARVELEKAEDQAAFTAAQPRVIDLFQTYLREMRPDELRGSAGTYRLRGELIARANIAIAPARIVDILFSELLVQ